MKAGRSRFLLLLLATGCATLGSEPPFPSRVSTTGVGPFRIITADESGLGGSPPGRVVGVGSNAIGRGMVASGLLFYSSAPPLSNPPDRDEDLFVFDVDWAQYEPRRIFRGTPREGELSFDGGEEILLASESWEGEAVFDPWIVELEDGSARMYYAAEGGIGIAEASDVAGAFTRLDGNPVVGPLADETISHPTVVQLESDLWVLYFSSDEAIYAATSSNGLAFTRVDGDPATSNIDPLDLTAAPPDDPEGPTEVIVRQPGVVVTTTPIGRRVVRLYFQVIRSDDTTALSMAASLDGLSFERFSEPVFSGDHPGSPAPLVLDDLGSTILYCTIESTFGDLQARALVAAVAPTDIAPELLGL